MTDVWAYKAMDLRTGELCEHVHHSKQSAERCAGRNGWIRFKVKRVPSRPDYDKGMRKSSRNYWHKVRDLDNQLSADENMGYTFIYDTEHRLEIRPDGRVR